MEVNFICKKCKTNYDYEVGKPSMDKNMSLVFENKPVCPNCAAVDLVLLSELGQSQMTQWHLKDL